MIVLQRAYDRSPRGTGPRYLVERLWPRGVRKDTLHLTGWLKDVAPSTGLRQWFAHDPEKWAEFRRRYGRELARHEEALRPLLTAARRGKVTLIYSSRDREHNNAVALKAFLEERLRHGHKLAA